MMTLSDTRSSQDWELEPDSVTAHCQFKGQGKFVPVILQLQHGHLRFLQRDSNKTAHPTESVVLRTAQLLGCKVQKPKKRRKGRKDAVRVDLATADSFGDTKYIIDLPATDPTDLWMKHIIKSSVDPQYCANRTLEHAEPQAEDCEVLQLREKLRETTEETEPIENAAAEKQNQKEILSPTYQEERLAATTIVPSTVEPEPEPEPQPEVAQPQPKVTRHPPKGSVNLAQTSAAAIPTSLIDSQVFPARLSKRKVRVTVDTDGLLVQEDSNEAKVIGKHALSTIVRWEVGSKGNNVKVLFKTTGRDSDSCLEFVTKTAAAIALALQRAKMARLAWLELQKLDKVEQSAVAEQFSRVPLLKACSTDQLMKLARHTARVKFKEGELIVRQGDMTDSLYIVESGHAVAKADAEQGNGTAYSAGDVFGEVALIESTVRKASVYAAGSETTTCFRILVEDVSVPDIFSAEELARMRQNQSMPATQQLQSTNTSSLETDAVFKEQSDDDKASENSAGAHGRDQRDRTNVTIAGSHVGDASTRDLQTCKRSSSPRPKERRGSFETNTAEGEDLEQHNSIDDGLLWPERADDDIPGRSSMFAQSLRVSHFLVTYGEPDPEIAEAAIQAMQEADHNCMDWLSELQSMQSDGTLDEFLESLKPTTSDDEAVVTLSKPEPEPEPEPALELQLVEATQEAMKEWIAEQQQMVTSVATGATVLSQTSLGKETVNQDLEASFEIKRKHTAAKTVSDEASSESVAITVQRIAVAKAAHLRAEEEEPGMQVRQRQASSNVTGQAQGVQEHAQVESADTTLTTHASTRFQVTEPGGARTATLTIDQKLKEIEDKRRERERTTAVDAARAGLLIQFNGGLVEEQKVSVRMVSKEDSAAAREVLCAAAAESDEDIKDKNLRSMVDRYTRLHPASKYVATDCDAGATVTNAPQKSTVEAPAGSLPGRSIFDRYVAAHPASRYLAPTQSRLSESRR